MYLAVTLIVGLIVASANGANDNFKGVATLYGSGTTPYKPALLWATLTTAAGSLAAIAIAGRLLEAFSGSGLVPTEVASAPRFSLGVALAAGTTVLLATRLSFPVSTTHALIGGLIGAGTVMSPSGIDVDTLAKVFLLPLVSSPFLAIALTAIVYSGFTFARRQAGISHETCVCIGDEIIGIAPGRLGVDAALSAIEAPTISIADRPMCEVRYSGKLIGVQATRLLDIGHFVTAGLVSFARGLNDTPKIAALLLVGGLLSAGQALGGVALAIAAGGWFGARRVAETLSHEITDMNAGQGFTANLLTAGLVIGASNLGLPVSTTHVACGSLFGIGVASRRAHWQKIVQIVAAWLVTLPVAALLGAAFAVAFSALL